MSLNLKKMVVAAAVVASTVGFFAESAKAQTFPNIPGLNLNIPIAQHSGDSDFKQDQIQLEASFDILTDRPFDRAFNNFSLTNPTNGETLFTSAIGSIEADLLESENEVEEFLANVGLNDFGITRDDVFAQIPNGEESIASYVVDLNDLNSNEEGKLILFYDNALATFPEEGALNRLAQSTAEVVRYVGTETVPGVFIRDSRENLDNLEQVRNGRTVDLFGVGVDFPASRPFSVTTPATVSEPTTGSSLLIAGAFGGLFILKRNQRMNKQRAKIEN